MLSAKQPARQQLALGFALPPADRPADPSPARADAEAAARRDKALLVHARLCPLYGCPIAFFHDDIDPLSELVSSLLSHRTRNADSGAAFSRLRARFATWEALRDAELADVRTALDGVTWPEQKAPRLQAVLRAITERRGTLALEFLGDMPVPAARAWLESLPGVGPKTSAAVLLFSRLRRPALPVDSHHHRVAVRLGLLPSGTDVGPAHALLAAALPSDWDAQAVYDHHEVLMLHGQRCCFHRAPACSRCPLTDVCLYPARDARAAKTSE